MTLGEVIRLRENEGPLERDQLKVAIEGLVQDIRKSAILEYVGNAGWIYSWEGTQSPPAPLTEELFRNDILLVFSDERVR